MATPHHQPRAVSGFRWQQAGVWRGLSSGWAIFRPGATPAYLQIATGLWCPADQATWFPIRATAEAYLRQTDANAEIVYVRRRSTGELVQQPADILADPSRRLA